MNTQSAIASRWSIIPCGVDKKPLFPWKAYQDRAPSQAEIAEWQNRYSPPAWAVICGQVSGLVILDFDGAPGMETLGKLGLKPHVLTPSGGAHVYFQHPGWKVQTLNGKSKKALGASWPGLDIRADGGYALFCGRNQKGEYQWVSESGPYSLDVLPAEVRDALGLLHRPGANGNGSGSRPVHTSALGQNGKGQVSAELLIQRALDQAVGEGRNNAGFWLACQLRDNGFSTSQAEAAMIEYSQRVPGVNTKGQGEAYTRGEALASLREAYRGAAREAWSSGSGNPVIRPSRRERPEQLNTETGELSGGGLPAIQVNNRQLRDITTDALKALQASNDPPAVFVRSGAPVGVVQLEDGRHVITELTESHIRGHLARSADFYSLRGKGDEARAVCVPPPLDVVKDLLALPPMQWRFPALEGITETPILRTDGTIVQTPGYDPRTRLVFAPAPDLRLPRIPDAPDQADLTAALETITDLIGQFPFVDQASQTNAIASLITLVIRSAIPGSVPLCLNDAPQAGTGKTLLAEVEAIVATGREASLFSAPRDDEEWRKVVTSALVDGSTVIIMDNVNSRLDASSLAKALTAVTWADRLLGVSRKVELPVRCTWIATGNNIQLGGDLPRRCYWVRMDAQTSKPYLRTDFRHPDLKAWAKQNRGRILASVLTIARAWYAAGKPKPTVKTLGSFEAWTTIVGGMLEHAGVHGFLYNCEELWSNADQEAVQWELFLLALREEFGHHTFTTSEIYARVIESNVRYKEPVREALPDDLAEWLDRPGSFQRRLGKALRARTGRRFGDSQVYVIQEKPDAHNKVVRWSIGGN